MTELNFASLGLAQPLLRAVTDAGYVTPTPIQAQAIPLVLAGGDLLAAAQTGTGKTAGFTLPLLHRLLNSATPRQPGRPRALVLTPTRELAAQVEESVKTYSKHIQLTSMVMFGGVGIGNQIQQLKRPVDILVATPGRLLDHAGQKTVDLSAVEILVLDEADRMLDMGFIRDIRKVLAMLPAKRQNLLFSATFSDEIKALADGLLHQPGLVEVARRNTTNELVSQAVTMVDRDRKTELLTHLIKAGDWHQVLVFTRTKHGANRLAEKLSAQGIASMAIHGNKSQNARTKALAEFKSGSLPVLCATDIAARGLDIEELPHVINFELPNVPEDYVHRIGRTGRAGCSGEALSLVCVDELKLLKDIEKLIKRTIERKTMPGYEADMSVAPQPILRGRQGAPAGGGRNNPPRQQARAQPGKPAQPKPAAQAAARPSASKPTAQRPAGQAPTRPANAAPRAGQGQPGQQRPAASASQHTPVGRQSQPRQQAALFSAPKKG